MGIHIHRQLPFLDQLGSLAQRSVKTVMVNTLASSDYGLLEENTLDPRPDYWAAVLWKQLMGTRVLDPGVPPADGFRVYAQCAHGQPGAVTLLAINFGKEDKSLSVDLPGQRYSLSATDPASKTVKAEWKSNSWPTQMARCRS